ncbi:MAG: hypothetical protein QG622_1599 [Actinomycetota bacterium]|nr:hypothetical protein [Actinomycetota bacterium]
MIGKGGPGNERGRGDELGDRGGLRRVHRHARDTGAETYAQRRNHECAAREPAEKRTERATATAGVHETTVGGYLSE